MIFRKIFFYLIAISTLVTKANTNTDSLIRITKNSEVDSLKISAYNELAKIVFYYDTQLALSYTNNALSLAQKSKNSFLEGITRLNVSSILYHTGEYKEGIKQASSSLKIFTTLRAELEIAKSYNNLSLLYQTVGDYPTALDFAFQALRIAEKLNDLKQLSNIHNNIGVIYYSLGMQNKSIEYFLKSLDNNIKINNQQGMAIGYLNMGTSFMERNDLKKAGEFLHKSLQINKTFNQNTAIANCYNNISNLHFLKKNLDSAFIYIKWAEEIYKNLNDSIGLATVYFQKGNYLQSEEKHTQAISEYKIAESYVSENFEKQKEINLYVKLSETYAAKNDFKNAYQYFLLSAARIDSLNSAEYKKKAQEMQIRFETKSMESEISRLQQESELRQIEISNQKKEINSNKNQRIFLLLIVSLLAFLLLMLIYILVGRNKLNRKLSLQNTQIIKQKEEKELLLKEIHHRVKNNLQIVNSLLRLQSNQINDEKINELFEEAQNRIITMALIHEKIYRTENLAKIDFKEYIESLSGNLIKTYNLNKTIQIDKKIDVEYFGIDQLVPIGLILNEILSNSFKYAFKNFSEGKIWISFFSNKDGKYSLIVGDSGIGFSLEEFETPKSLGLELIKTFTEQLNGTIELNTQKGTEYKIIF
jgi:two-component sensor histidine kinase